MMRLASFCASVLSSAAAAAAAAALGEASFLGPCLAGLSSPGAAISLLMPCHVSPSCHGINTLSTSRDSL